MMFFTPQTAGILLMFLSVLSSTALGAPMMLSDLKKEADLAAKQARTAATNHFLSLEKAIPKLGHPIDAHYNSDYIRVFRNPSERQKELHEEHVDRDKAIAYYDGEEAENIRRLNGVAGEYASTYPLNHLGHGASHTDRSVITDLDDKANGLRRKLRL